MSCDCPSAPSLSGPVTYNVTKLAGERVTVTVPWCVPVGGALISSSWSAAAPITEPPLVIGDTSSGSEGASAELSGGTSGDEGCGSRGTLYRVLNTVVIVPPSGPNQTLTATIWVWVPLDPPPSVQLDC